MGQTLGSALAERTTRWDFLKRPQWGFPESVTGPLKPRPPTPGLHLPPGTHIPDWRQYKVENSPELLEVQKKLAARGLKDPWLRNEVWRYDTKMYGTYKGKFLRQLVPGMLYGLALFAVVVVCEETIFKKEDHHGHHDSQGHDGHHDAH